MSSKTVGSGAWKVRLFGEFALTRPTGEPVRLGYAKLEGLLAMLVVSGARGVSRKAAIESLWHDVGSGAGSLRQAILRLKQALGEGAIFSNRERCRLSSDFEIVSDYDGSTQRGSGIFMADQDGAWFEAIREELELSDKLPEPSSSVQEGFLQLLDWYCRWDAERLQLLMMADVDLVLSLPTNVLLDLVKCLPESDQGRGWAWFWRGASAGRGSDQLRCFARAYRCGDASKDRRLMFLSASEACAAYIVADKPQEADQLLRACQDLAAKDRSKYFEAKCNILRGLCTCHFGDPELGLNYLREGERAIGDPITLGRRLLIRSFMETSAGNVAQGEQTLQEALRVSRVVKGPCFETFREFAELHLGRDSELIVCETGPRFLKSATNRAHPHLVIYASEFVATHAAKLGNLTLARNQKATADRIRSACQSELTNWDRARLRGYHQAVG